MPFVSLSEKKEQYKKFIFPIFLAIKVIPAEVKKTE